MHLRCWRMIAAETLADSIHVTEQPLTCAFMIRRLPEKFLMAIIVIKLFRGSWVPTLFWNGSSKSTHMLNWSFDSGIFPFPTSIESGKNQPLSVSNNINISRHQLRLVKERCLYVMTLHQMKRLKIVLSTEKMQWYCKQLLLLGLAFDLKNLNLNN